MPFGQPLTETPRRLRVCQTLRCLILTARMEIAGRCRSRTSRTCPINNQHWSMDFAVSLPMVQTRHVDVMSLSPIGWRNSPSTSHSRAFYPQSDGQTESHSVKISGLRSPMHQSTASRQRRRGRRRKDGGNPRSPHGRRAVPPHGRKCSPKKCPPRPAHLRCPPPPDQ